MKTFVIAEAGANHNRDWAVAKNLVYTASASGASAIKFQSYTSSKLYSSATPDFGIYKNIPDLISSIELPREWYPKLAKLCLDCDIEFMSTPFDEDAVDLLYRAGVKRMKIAAFESSDTRLVRCVASTKLPIIFSAGIKSGIAQIKHTLDVIYDENPNADVAILHCNSSYPTPYQDINLGQLSVLQKEFGNKQKIGLSDHTNGILIPPVAVALGATVIEKHFTMSRSMTGPDHAFAIEPHELFTMIKDISNIEASLGIKKGNEMSESEKNNDMCYAMRSLIAKKKIHSGEILTCENVTTKRPYIAGNIPASEYDDVIGKYVATKDINSDEMISTKDVMVCNDI